MTGAAVLQRIAASTPSNCSRSIKGSVIYPVSFAVLFFFRSLFIRVSCHLIQESACQDCSRCAEIGVWVFLRSFSFVWFGTKYKLIRTAVQNSILVRRLRFWGRNRFVREIRIDGFIWEIRESGKSGKSGSTGIQRRIRYRFCLFQLSSSFSLCWIFSFVCASCNCCVSRSSSIMLVSYVISVSPAFTTSPSLTRTWEMVWLSER